MNVHVPVEHSKGIRVAVVQQLVDEAAVADAELNEHDVAVRLAGDLQTDEDAAALDVFVDPSCDNDGAEWVTVVAMRWPSAMVTSAKVLSLFIWVGWLVANIFFSFFGCWCVADIFFSLS